MKLTFCGAAKEVTGVNYLLEGEKVKILIDCGMFQGPHYLTEQNSNPFPYDPASIDFLFVSHAHVDHVGRIPQLYKAGFRGKIFCTRPTRDLTRISLVDSYRLVEDNMAFHHVKPLYSLEDIYDSMDLFEGVDYDKKIKIPGKLEFCLREAGHILGSAITEIWLEGEKFTFTGDLGNSPPPLIRPTARIDETDYLTIESTYGDRNHVDQPERKLILERTIEETVAKKGVLMIPIMALERSQEILFELNELVEHSRIPRVPIFIDSPLAIKFTEVYDLYQNLFNSEALKAIRAGDELFNFPGLSLSLTKEQSIAINEVRPPKIIIAGSGSSMGGRIVQHEKRYLSDPNSCVLMVGYQIAGSLGRKLQDGAKVVEIHGEKIEVKCQVRTISGYSGHADQRQLRAFVANIKKPIKKVFVTQGEPGPSAALAQIIRDELGTPAVVPDLGQSFEV